MLRRMAAQGLVDRLHHAQAATRCCAVARPRRGAARVARCRRGARAPAPAKAGLARMMVGAGEALLRVRRARRGAGDSLLVRREREAPDECARPASRGVSLHRCAPARSSGVAGVSGNGQAALAEADRSTGACARATSCSTVDDAHACEPGRDRSSAASPQSRRTGTRDGRDRRACTLCGERGRWSDLRHPAARAGRLAVPEAARRARGRPAARVRRARRWAGDARGVALGRQPAEGRRRARGVA